MAVPTIYRLAEECQRLLAGGDPDLASKVHINELKISIAQVANQLLKIDYVSTNLPMGEIIPNGAVLGLYEGVTVTSSGGRSTATLPIKPIKLPRNLGVYSVFDSNDHTCEFIPLQMGQANLIRSQPLINALLGQTGFEVFGSQVVFTDDIAGAANPVTTVDMRLMILDISQYSDYDPLPILPEMEWQIKQEVVRLYMGEPVADKVVDPGRAEQKGVPLNQQSQ